MTAAAATANKLLITLPEAAAAQAVFTQDNGLAPFIAAIRAETEGRVFDVSTNKGRTECASLAYSVTRSKTALDDLGKQVVAKLKELPKQIDANRKSMREELEALAEEIRRPVTEWEDAEKRRKEKIEADLRSLKNTSTEGMPADAIRAKLQAVEAVVIDESWQEYEAEAHRTKAASIELLREKLASREQFDRDQAELAELRRLKAQDEERRKAAEAEQAQAQAQELEVAQVLQPATNEVPPQHLGADEFDESGDLEALGGLYSAPARQPAPAVSAAQPARITGSTDMNRVLEVLGAAKQALIYNAGLTEEQARAVVNLIRQGKVPAVTLSYEA
ncbi:hypothetical protein ACF8C6_08900 [Pseudomonas sp. zbq_18]|uniref:hypothetical protein n=1 Tax=Pseudomonas sp. zbq_18 TaxID=3367251 RepID=UPI00370B2FDE